MSNSPTTVVVPAKVALSRHERFVESACHACRACWGGLAIFQPDGSLRDHLTFGLSADSSAIVRASAPWTDHLQQISKRPNHKSSQRDAELVLPVVSSIGLSWPLPGNARGVLYVVRSQGEPFGPSEKVTLQALSQLLVSESQQDESHLIAKLRVLNQVAQAAASLRDLEDLFALALLELERHIPWHCAAIWLCDDAQSSDTLDGPKVSKLRLANCSERAQRHGLVKDMMMAVADSIFVPCVQENAATYVDSAELATSTCMLARTLLKGGASAAFAVPLRAGPRMLGILQCVCLRPGGFANEQIQLFYLVADLLGPAIAQALWLQRLMDANGELRAAQAQLIQSEKFRALGEMASGMAHDFNNALCGVLGFLELALLEPTLTPTSRTYLESSKTCALDAAHTVRRVQEFARRHRTEADLEPIQIDDLVRQTVGLTRHKWDSLTQLDKPISAEVATKAGCVVHANASELREALTNLIFNAVDAMPHGGKLTIRTVVENGECSLFVEDTGVGIPEDAKRRLFEPFFTTKGERGNGLGLSVTFGIIQRHGGRISVESKVGRGTSFRIHLPIWTEVSEGLPLTDPEILLPSVPSRILVVEDEESIRRFLSAGLLQLGYQPQTASSAEKALEAMSRGTFDVILTDLGLPGMSGAELARTVQQRAPGTPVVLLTGWGEQIQAENQQIDGVAHILAKPVTMNVLAKTLALVRCGAVAL